jgi:hypothetical protein
LLGYSIDPENFFSSTGRFKSYAHLLSWIYHGKHWMFGQGSGSFALVSNAMNHAGQLKTLVPWAHSDYMQMLFENGIVGLVFMILIDRYTILSIIDSDINQLGLIL